MNREFAYVFEGDDRHMVEADPAQRMPGNPIPVRRSQARMLGQMFDEKGWSYDTLGNTLWVTIAYAQYKGYKTVLKGSYIEGWTLTKVH